MQLKEERERRLKKSQTIARSKAPRLAALKKGENREIPEAFTNRPQTKNGRPVDLPLIFESNGGAEGIRTPGLVNASSREYLP
jgi:hypothetical protein